MGIIPDESLSKEAQLKQEIDYLKGVVDETQKELTKVRFERDTLRMNIRKIQGMDENLARYELMDIRT